MLSGAGEKTAARYWLGTYAMQLLKMKLLRGDNALEF